MPGCDAVITIDPVVITLSELSVIVAIAGFEDVYVIGRPDDALALRVNICCGLYITVGCK